MSWSVSKTVKAGSDETDWADTREQALQQNPECGDQFDAALDAAVSLLNSGAIGSDRDFRVALSGHANPNHEPREGWSNDMITIQIQQA